MLRKLRGVCRGCMAHGTGAGQFAQRPVGMDQRAPPPLPRGASFEYRYMTEFQSHEPEFDYLKSLEIEEKINKVRWCRSSNNTRMLLSTNDKTVKLWKVGSEALAVAQACAMCLTCLSNRSVFYRAGVREEGVVPGQFQSGGPEQRSRRLASAQRAGEQPGVHAPFAAAAPAPGASVLPHWHHTVLPPTPYLTT